MLASRRAVATARSAAARSAPNSLTHAARRQCQSAWPAASSRSAWRALSTSSRRQRADVFASQLESIPNAADLLSPSTAATDGPPQTVTEKIVQNYSVGLAPGKKVKSGDFVTIEPLRCMTHDNTWPVAKKFMEIGATEVRDKDQLIFALDHDISNLSESNTTKYSLIQQFAKKHGVRFHPAGQGIGHQLMLEHGYAWPGTMTVASDSHTNMMGGIGTLGTPVVRTDAASVWATGRTWWQVPPVCKITFTGVLPPGVSGKDVIVALIGLFSNDEVLNHCIEYHGSEETMRSLPVNDRLTIANMSTEHGALSGLFPIDSVLISWLRAKATTAAMLSPDGGAGSPFTHERIDELVQNRVQADPGATYAKTLYMNLSTLQPYVSGPNSVKVANPVRDLEAQNISIDKAYLVSCTNARRPDFQSAARVFREAAERGETPKIKDGVKFYIAAASALEQKAAEEAGDWQVLLDAGAQPLPAGCGPCIGLGPGLLEAGEVGISASNRNFSGRMGSRDAKAYLASPEVVAASALQGKIAGPGWYEKPDGVEKVIIGEGSGDYEADKALSIEDALDKLIAEADSLIAAAEGGSGSTAEVASDAEETLTEILPGFPEKIEGEIVFCNQDNLNTDGIYPGKYTYQDNVSTETMAEVCMENYDPEFRTIAQEGDILVGGYNWGTGSSREQAATSILAKKIPLVVAGSFGNIFSRNAINNALLCVELPKLITRLRETFKDDKALTRRTGWKLVYDVRRSKVIVTEKGGETWSEKIGELPPNVQEIIALGGLENWVKAQIQK